MERRQKLIDYICNSEDERNLIVPLIDELLFLEGQMIDLKKLPFIKVNLEHPEMQKATPAAKQYKELLQQYTNIIKVLEKKNNLDGDEKESPLRAWVNKYVNK